MWSKGAAPRNTAFLPDVTEINPPPETSSAGGSISRIANRQRTNTRLRRVEKGVGDGRRDADDGRFTGANRWQIRAVHQKGLDLRHVFEARHVVLGKLRVQHPAVFETHFFAERAAEAHDDAAFHLSGEVRRILNGAALERLDRLKHFERADAVVHFDSNGAGDVGTLLRPARQADAGLLCRGVLFPRALPTELVGSGDEHGAQAIVGQMAKPKFQGIDAGLFAASARRAASTATSPECLPPKPPPVSGTITRTSLSGSRNVLESSSRTREGCWVPVQTVSLPFSHSATAARGSMGACWM